MFDNFQSRRGYEESCRWWSRNENDDISADEIRFKRVASGSFDAREMTAEQLMNLNLGGVFRIDSTHVTIKTPDDLSTLNDDVMKGDVIVEYQGEIWMVDNVQKSKAKLQNTQYANDKDCSHFWYLELRK